jgi:hypothetical protein
MDFWFDFVAQALQRDSTLPLCLSWAVQVETLQRDSTLPLCLSWAVQVETFP